MSEAVGLERVSAVTGYKVLKGNFNPVTPNLPMRIAIIGEANVANQATLDVTPTELISAQQAGELYGFGSPIHMAMRILKPSNGGGLGGIPVIAYPQEEAPGATQLELQITPSGTVTKAGVHTIKVAGRKGLDGQFYNINIAVGDTIAAICTKISDALNSVLGCPFIGSATATEAIATSKWAGLTADSGILKLEIDTNGVDLGITYAISETGTATGTPDIQDALDLFGNDWNTLVVNTYGLNDQVMDTLESFNGVQDPVSPTGRYDAIVMKPFVALSGSTEEDPSVSSSLPDRLNQDTIALCPAPKSKGHPLEAAANMCVLAAKIAQETPHLDVQDLYYPDMPTPENIGQNADYNFRDYLVKNGCSTVDLVSGRYKVKDFVTTYRPLGENPPQFRYVRSLMQDWNVFFTYYLNEQTYVVGKALTDDSTIVTAPNVVKPSDWKARLYEIADELSLRALIADPSFMKESIVVGISTTNPDRIGTTFRYKRSGFSRIQSTVATAGFNFGTV